MIATSDNRADRIFAALRDAETAMIRSNNKFAAHDLRIAREQISFAAAEAFYDALVVEKVC